LLGRKKLLYSTLLFTERAVRGGVNGAVEAVEEGVEVIDFGVGAVEGRCISYPMLPYLWFLRILTALFACASVDNKGL
jgi:hypothetical protein